MRSHDRDAVLALADRLTVGVARWRAHEAVLQAVWSWVTDAVATAGDEMGVYVAVEGAEVVGFVSVSESAHWTGELDAYVGELVVRPDHEKRGVGTQLVSEAERWAATRGLRRIRLSTGAANTAALRLYDALGYEREDVTLSKGVLGQGD